MLYRMGGRFRGLFLIDYILYQTDKHVRDNITMLCLELAMGGINIEDIKDIYVLGHSLGDADFKYFAFLTEATQEEKDAIYRKFLEEQQKRDAAIEEEFGKMFQNGKWYRRSKTSNRLAQMNGKSDATEGDRQMSPMNLDFARSGRMSDARWHITYYSAGDKKCAECLMKVLGCTDYELFGSIDEAVEKIRKKQD